MDGLKADLYLLVSALADEPVIWADQNSPRPALPYWTMRINTIPTLGSAVYGQGVNALGDQSITRVNQATVALQRYGVDSEIKCHALKSDLDKMTVREAWGLRQLACYDTGAVNNISTKLDNATIEPRAAMDLFVRFGSRVVDRVGIIDTVQIEGQYPDAISSEVIDTVVSTG